MTERAADWVLFGALAVGHIAAWCRLRAYRRADGEQS